MAETYGGMTAAQWQELSDAGFGSGGTGGTEARIRKDFPALAWMLDIKDLKPIMLDAFGQDKPFDQNLFDSKLWATDWWKQNGENSREWQRIKAMDPAQSRIQLEQGAQMLSRRLGIPLNQTGFLRPIVELGMMLDLDPDTLFETAVNMIDAGKVKGIKPFSGTGGTIGSEYARIKEMSKDYMVQLSHDKILDTAKKTATGRIDEGYLDEFFKRTAKSKWAHLSDQIDAGITPSEFFSGHQQAAAQLLEYGNPDQVNLMDTKWKRVTSFNDGGKIRPMTIAETEKFVRGTEEWGTTRNAQEEASTVAETLLNKFGATK